NVLKFRYNAANSSTNSFHSDPLIFPTVCRQQNTSKGMIRGGTYFGLLKCDPQRINACVASHEHTCGVNPLGFQVSRRTHSRAEMPLRQPVRNHSIKLLRERRTKVACPQASFDMAEWNSKVKGRERRNHESGCVALCNNDVRPIFSDHALHWRQEFSS